MIFLIVSGFFFAGAVHGMDEAPKGPKYKDEAPERKKSSDDSTTGAQTALTRRDSKDDPVIIPMQDQPSPKQKTTPRSTPRFNLNLRDPENSSGLKMSIGSQDSGRQQQRVVRFDDLSLQVQRAKTVKSLKKKADQSSGSTVPTVRKRKFLGTGESLPSLPLVQDDADTPLQAGMLTDDKTDKAPIQDYEKRMQQMEKVLFALHKKLSDTKNISVADDDEVSEEVVRRFAGRFGQAGIDNDQHYCADDMWGIIKRFCPILFTIAQDRRMTLEEALDFDDMTEGVEVGSPVFVQIAHGIMGDDNSDATASWAKKAWNYFASKPDGVSLSQAYSIKRYEQMKEATPEQHKILVYEALKAAYEQADGGVRRSSIFDTQMGIHTEQIADQQDTIRKQVIAFVTAILLGIPGWVLTVYSQISPCVCPANATA